jgi:hypothetical protein
MGRRLPQFCPILWLSRVSPPEPDRHGSGSRLPAPDSLAPPWTARWTSGGHPATPAGAPPHGDTPLLPATLRCQEKRLTAESDAPSPVAAFRRCERRSIFRKNVPWLPATLHRQEKCFTAGSDAPSPVAAFHRRDQRSISGRDVPSPPAALHCQEKHSISPGDVSPPVATSHLCRRRFTARTNVSSPRAALHLQEKRSAAPSGAPSPGTMLRRAPGSHVPAGRGSWRRGETLLVELQPFLHLLRSSRAEHLPLKSPLHRP